MTFFREIATKNITQEYINTLDQENTTLIWKEDSVEIWVNIEELNRFTGR